MLVLLFLQIFTNTYIELTFINMFFLGILTPFKIITYSVIYLAFLAYSLYLALKNESKYLLVLWVLIILFIPFIGSIMYILKYHLNKRKLKID